MARIFVNYRHSVAQGQAAPIIAWLDHHFDADVFADIRIEPGERFLDKIESELASVEAFVAIIGHGWLDTKDETGKSRLDDPEDVLRVEIATALRRDIVIVPVLVQDAAMPGKDQLPEDLRALAEFHALRITFEAEQFLRGMERLTKRLESILKQAEPEPKPDPGEWPEPPRPPPPKAALIRPVGPLAFLAGLMGLLLLVSGVFVKTSKAKSFLEPKFGDQGNFHGLVVLWRLASVFTTLPTVAIAVAALAGLVLAGSRRPQGPQWLGTGLLLGAGLQGAAVYLGRLISPEGWKGWKVGFMLAVLGGLTLIAVGLWSYRELTRVTRPGLDDPSLDLSVRLGAVAGAALIVIGMVVNFNGGGSDGREEGSIFSKGDLHRWDFLAVVTVLLAVALVSRRMGPAQLSAGLLIAVGMGTACLWLRFAAIPAMQSPSAGSIAAGGFIGLVGAILVLGCGVVATRAARAAEPVPPLTAAHA
jgi:hypothetical protein